jgi:nitrile hydratase accessory protein
LFRPDDPLAPAGPVFAEQWQAQALALADSLVRAGRLSACAWAEALGAELRAAETAGAPDTQETYYRAVVAALETVLAEEGGIGRDEQEARRAAWEDAYLAALHGTPVRLGPDPGPEKAD